MDRKSKSRLLLGGLIVFSALIAIYTYWVFLKSENQAQDWQAFLLNVSTELIGALIVFFFFNLFFFLDDWDLSERVIRLLNKLETERPSAEKFFHKLPELEGYIHNSQQIDMCGLTLTSAINKQISNLRDQMANGALIRIIIVDPALNLSRGALSDGSYLDITYNKTRHEATFKDLEYLFRKQDEMSQLGINGKIEVRLLPQALGVGIYGFNTAQPDGKILVELYPPTVGTGYPPSFSLLQKTDELWFTYFQNQFEEMWKKSKLWSPEIGNDTKDLLNANSKVAANDFLLPKLPTYQKYIEKASEVYLYGEHLRTTIDRNLPALNKVLLDGGIVKIIISTLEAARKNNNGIERAESLGTLYWLNKNPQNKGRIEVREFNKAKVFSMHIIDPNHELGRIFIRMRMPTASYEALPKFELLKKRDEYWFNFFIQQWHQMWEASQPLDLETQSGATQPLVQNGE